MWNGIVFWRQGSLIQAPWVRWNDLGDNTTFSSQALFDNCSYSFIRLQSLSYVPGTETVQGTQWWTAQTWLCSCETYQRGYPLAQDMLACIKIGEQRSWIVVKGYQPFTRGCVQDRSHLWPLWELSEGGGWNEAPYRYQKKNHWQIISHQQPAALYF
jgi:hypothetical protein